MRPLKLFHRADERPPLKDRLAALKARLGRITRRPDSNTDPQRRVMLAGSLAAAIPLPALAAPIAEAFQTDRAVFEAAARMHEAERAYYAADTDSDAAHEAVWTELGICPSELILHPWHRELGRLTYPGAPDEVRCTRVFQWVRGDGSDTNSSSQAWTAPGLRIAIEYAVPMFGRGGQTPHRIRRWRSLIPAAEAFEARRAQVEARHRLRERLDAYTAAGRAWTAAQQAFDATPATTVAGLALIAHHVGECGVDRMPANWRNLLASAANVSGVALRERDGACAPTFM